MPWGTIALGVRIARHPEPEFFASWTRLLVEGLQPGDVVLEPACRMRGTRAANVLVRRFLASGADSLLLVDDDMTFPSTALSLLRFNPDNWCYDVVSALAVRRIPPYVPVVMRRMEPQPAAPFDRCGEYCDNVTTWEPDQVLPVDVCGLAFTLVRRRVFEVMRDPGVPDELCYWFGGGIGDEGDDKAFSRRVRAAGGRLAVDTGCEIGHVSAQPVTVADFRREREMRDLAPYGGGMPNHAR